MSRTIRKERTGAKRWASSCSNHGSCDYCKGNRLHKHKKKTVKEEVTYNDEP